MKIHPVWGDSKPGKGKKTEPIDDPVVVDPVEEPEEPIVDDPIEWQVVDAGNNTEKVITGLVSETTYSIAARQHGGSWSESIEATTK